MPSHLLGVMQFFGVVLGLVASCALLPGHNRVKAPSTLSVSPAVNKGFALKSIFLFPPSLHACVQQR